MRAGAWTCAAGVAVGCWLSCACGERGEEAREELGAAGYEVTPAGFLEAAAAGEVEVMKAFVKGGMEVGVKDEAGDTALHAAARGGAEKAVDWLLDRKLAVDLSGAGGKTSLAVAAEAGQAAMVRHLLRQGADPSLRDAEGYKPLQRAVAGGMARVVEELAPRDRGDLDAALLMAALLGKAEVIDALTKYGASVYARMGDGRTALMLAAENGQEAAVRMLLEIGANRFALDERGRTAAELARGNGHEGLVALLEGAEGSPAFGIEETNALAERMLASLDETGDRVPEEAAAAPGGQLAAAPPARDGLPVPPAAGTGGTPPTGIPGEDRPAAKRWRMLEGAVVSVAAGVAGSAAAGSADRVDGGADPGGPAAQSGPAAGAGAKTGSAAAAWPALIMRDYRESEMPVRVKAVTGGKVRLELLAGGRREVEVAAGEPIPGSRLRVTRIVARVASGKEHEGRPEDVSRVEVEDTANGLRRQWVAGTSSQGHDPFALLEDEATGERYLATQGARFRASDGSSYVVCDVRANQVVLEKSGGGGTVTLPIRGPRG